MSFLEKEWIMFISKLKIAGSSQQLSRDEGSSHFYTELATRTHNFELRDEGVFHLNNRLLYSKLPRLKRKTLCEIVKDKRKRA
ncbi:hypothetical protein H5410_025028 [Solanum commersonii]|uniref:Uncharacterized protein n=1 Tax=Solanum commersonii TaxID=4109 RepID=A0A9J5YUS8_SOLCO|nr:hypothetical protein H5410_025028 [Solanum commersonii]